VAARVTRVSLRLGGWTLGLVLLLSLVLGAGTSRLRSLVLEGHLEPDDPVLLHRQEAIREFGSDAALVAALGCDTLRPCRDVFEPGMLQVIRALSEQAAAAAGVAEVTSLATVGVLASHGAALRAERLPGELDAASIGRFRELLARDPVIPRSLLSADARTTLIVVRFEPRLSPAERHALVLDLEADLRRAASRAEVELRASGAELLDATGDQGVRRDLQVLTPLMIGLLLLVLLWVFREPKSVVLTLLAVGLPTLWTFGLMGWTGRPITPVSSTLPILILVVGVTDAVHFLVRAYELRGTRGSLEETLLEVAREVGPPTTVTALTSALGFLSFLAAPMPNLREFGVFAAIGILGAWLLSFSLLPVALVRLPRILRAPRSAAFGWGDRVLGAVHRVARRHAQAIAGATVAIAALALFGISRIEVDTDTISLRGERDAVVQDERFIREQLGAAAWLDVVVRAHDGRSLIESDALARLERAEAALAAEAAGPVLSVLPALRIANRELGDGTLAVPRDPHAASQLLLLAEAADPDALARVLTPDRAAARLSAGFAWGGVAAIEQQTHRLGERLAAILGDGEDWFVTGHPVFAARIGDLILESQVASFTTAFLTIFAVLFLFLRSVPLGLLGIVPNLFPVIAILGFMGFAGIHLDVGTAMIASILIGVSVDDTIYFLLHYREARRGGATVEDAVAHTFAIGGKPAIFCAAMLALGFGVLGLSSFRSLALFGLLSAGAVLLAVVAELFVLPALLELGAGRGERRAREGAR
jgi:predicted RND superfamily exporter protein